jgi:hypothetical protein
VEVGARQACVVILMKYQSLKEGISFLPEFLYRTMYNYIEKDKYEPKLNLVKTWNKMKNNH